jgi:hypothetical protein
MIGIAVSIKRQTATCAKTHFFEAKKKQVFRARRAARFSLNLNENQILFLGHVSIAKGKLS